jgi:ribonuclease P protein component
MTSRSFVVLVADQRNGTPDQAPRLGVTVSRRVGCAVVRTRVKRRVREWFRRNRGLFPTGKDIVVIARPAAAEIPSVEVGRELEGALRRLARAGGRS